MKFSMKATTLVIAAISLGIPLQSHAYLGDFEPQDGYLSYVNWVNGYNAGQYGTNNGGPGGVPNNPLQPPTANYGGLWQDKNGAFSTYNANSSVFMGGYYVTGHNTVAGLGMFPHNGTQMLALRNTSYATPTIPAQPLDYSYQVDTRDFYNGGSPVNPADTGDKIVDWSIWAGPGPRTAPSDGIWLSFLDSAGNIGFQFGWNELYELRYRDNCSGNTCSGPWTNLLDPNTNANYEFGRPWASLSQPVIYDHFNFSFDLLNDTWSLNVLSSLKGYTMPFITDLAFGQKLQNFTEIDWHVSYGNEKGFFDDSSFIIRPAQVPEPGSFALLALGCLLLWRAHSSYKQA